MKKEIYTPYGFRDKLFVEAAGARALNDRLHHVFELYGYHDITTPMVEYLKLFDEERGSIDPVNLYKFVDRDGELLVLRPDLTPAAARFAVTYLSEGDLPCRMCVNGQVFRYSGPFSGKARELYQTGIEFIGTDSAESDAEVLEAALDALEATGLKSWRMALGEAGLVREVLSLVPGDDLCKYVNSRNYPALDAEMQTRKVPEPLRQLVSIMTRTGGIELVNEALQYLDELNSEYDTAAARGAFARLAEVWNALQRAGKTDRLTVDPGMTPDLQYYTGIVFQAYADGSGEYILDGGRYDDLYRQFDRNWPAVGFGVQVNQVMQALQAQHCVQDSPKWVYVAGNDPALTAEAARYLRGRDIPVFRTEMTDRGAFEELYKDRSDCAIALWLDPEEDPALRQNLAEWLKEVLQGA
ncbi:MAG: ATP phosphoribosyltransferase regulatory subunit [Firmicutes bacterium]|nr:ATP phosphoribosyltransferase regulatory subunit [Bacillota bacterium]